MSDIYRVHITDTQQLLLLHVNTHFVSLWRDWTIQIIIPFRGSRGQTDRTPTRAAYVN